MSTILSDEQKGVFTISLNRPESLNAFTPDMLNALHNALTKAEQSSTARVVIVQGSGRAFSAGVDLKVLQGIDPADGKIGDVFDEIANKVTKSIRQHRLPVIAKVHGACFTGALEIALSCDFIFAESNTKFGDTHAKWGLRPTWGMAQNLARAVGVRRARHLSYSAQVFSGAQAADWGLANQAADSQEALDQLVENCAQQITDGSPGAISAYKELYRVHESYLPLEDALQEENQRQFPEISDSQERLGNFGS